MLNLPRFVFINGPAGCGKSTLATLLCEANPAVWREAFAEPIREMLRTVFFPEDSPIEGPDRVNFRDGEIKKQALLKLAGIEGQGLSVRQAMIDFSEHYMKPRFDEDIFGKLLYKRCEALAPWYSTFVIDDSGFVPEAQYVISKAGEGACLLIRLRRAGCSFVGDSRSYITLPNVPTIDISNDGAAAEMLAELELHRGAI